VLGRDLPPAFLHVSSIPVGKSDVHKFDLSAFYDFKTPDKYAVYLEVRDEFSDTWVRTNTVQFTMHAATVQ